MSSFLKKAHAFHLYLQKNPFCIKLYSILRWHEVWFDLKRFVYLDNRMKQNNFIIQIKNKTKFFLPLYKTDLIQKEILTQRNFYENDFLESILNFNHGIVKKALKSGIILDIGANIGNHTLFFFNKGAQSVFCFEPVKSTFEILKKNIELNNHQKKTKLFNTGIGQKQGSASIKLYTEDNIGMTQLTLNESGDIPILAIDDINFPSNISFIKIDVEGFELEVIKGMVKTIKKNHPIIMIEIRDYLFDEISTILQSLNYQCFTINDENESIKNVLYY